MSKNYIGAKTYVVVGMRITDDIRYVDIDDAINSFKETAIIEFEHLK